MSSERELDEGIQSIKSAWRREHTARANLEKMLEQADAENAKLRELCADMYEWMGRAMYDGSARKYEYELIVSRMRDLGIEMDK